jgi:2-hydroxycyclohexanecarboxyl-CoA dehydrogenase
MNGLSGKSVIVTGGGSGIGLAAAKILGDSGCLVTIADLNEAGRVNSSRLTSPTKTTSKRWSMRP